MASWNTRLIRDTILKADDGTEHTFPANTMVAVYSMRGITIVTAYLDGVAYKGRGRHLIT